MGPFCPPSPPRVDSLLVHNHTHNMALELAQETIWFDKWKCDDAEKQFYEKKTGGGSGLGNLASQIAKARQDIQNSLAAGGGHRGGGGAAVSTDVLNRITKLEDEKSALQKTVSTMEKTILDLTKRLAALETSNKTTTKSASPPKNSEPADDDDDDDEVDLFGSDDEEEDADAARVREERLKAYADKKAKKPGPIAKSSVLLD